MSLLVTFQFQQCPRFKQNLLQTTSPIVFADKKDKKLGVAVDKHDVTIGSEKNWCGENILGCVLTEIRDEFLQSHKVRCTRSD